MTIIAAPAQDVAKVYRTLGDLRRELQDRLGQGGAGSAGGQNLGNLNSQLRMAQSILYQEFDWHTLIRYQDQQLGANQYRVDYPSFMDAERLLQVAVNIGADGTQANWQKIKPGIPVASYNTLDSVSYPRRFEQYDQLEFYPKADRVYTIRIWGMKALPRFTEDADRPLIDDNLVLLWALASSKAHYKQADAAAVGNQLTNMRSKLRAKSWKQSVFDPNLGGPVQGPEWEPLNKPQVVGR